MRRWSETAEQIATTTRTSEKVTRLASYLGDLEEQELPIAVVFMSGRPFPERDARTTGLGWSAISSATAAIADVPAAALGEAYNASSDLGQAVGDVLAAADHVAHDPPSLPEVSAAFGDMAHARGSAAKAVVFRSLLARCDPFSAKYLVKILTGELRIGLREGHLEAAIARAFGRDLSAVQWAGMLTGDLGRTAQLARDGHLHSAELALFRPLKSMLASPAADESEVLSRLGAPVWVEDKYDGIRAQLHKLGPEAHLYSRDLHDVSGQFPEVVRAARSLPWDGILDGEVLAWSDGAALPFLQLQARLGRKDPSPEILASVPVIYVAFDLLALGEPSGSAVEPLLRHPLSDRRRRLETLGLEDTPGFGLGNLLTARDEAELGEVFAAAQQRGNEGLMVKDPDSGYSPGRRGYGWLKLKRPLATLDCLVVGVEVGHGKRHGVLSDYTFAVVDDRPGRDGSLVTIGKAYSGLTDAELATMTAWFTEHTLQQFGRYHLVEPTVVVEVAFDVVHRSNRHNSGFALRFPRIARLRPDKRPDEIDALSTVERLHGQLQAGGRYEVLSSAAPAAPAGPRRYL